MIINVDVDGVLRDIHTPYINIYNKIHNTNYVLSDIVNYSLNILLKLEKPKEFFLKHYIPIFRDAKPYDNIEYLNKLSKNNTIQIVTSQYKGLESTTIDWLNKNNVYYDSIHFTHDKQLIKGDVFLDDYIYHLNKSTCSDVICMDRTYNKEWNGKRISDIKDLYDLLNTT